MQEKLIFIGLILIVGSIGFSEEMVTLPWKEFKEVYQEHILKDSASPELKSEKLITSLTMSDYHLTINETNAILQIEITGKVIQGKPEIITLFDKDVVISGKVSVANGKIISYENAICILPNDDKDFKVSLNLLLNFQEDSLSQYVALNIPDTLQNKLTISLNDKLKLIEKPGIEDQNGAFFFSSKNDLMVRFRAKNSIDIKKNPSVDILTQFELKNSRLIGEISLFVAKKSSRQFFIQIPVAYHFISSSLKNSRFKIFAGNKMEIKIPEEKSNVITINFSAAIKENKFTVELPSIENNTGREGDFTLTETDEIELSFADNSIRKSVLDKYYIDLFKQDQRKNKHNCINSRNIKSEDYVQNAQKDIPNKNALVHSRFLFLEPGKTSSIKIRRLSTVKSPEIVLDAIYFFTAFEENGRSLSVLKFNLPATSKRRLTLKRIPNAEIWSLKVNGTNKKVFSLDQDSWVIPLEQNKASLVELAFIKKSEKLGINGKLDSIISATGMSAEKLFYAVALPERLNLISIDAPLSPAENKKWDISKKFVGNRYYFYSSFYKGEEVKVALFYQEPKMIK
jgi:hypothetical protein